VNRGSVGIRPLGVGRNDREGSAGRCADGQAKMREDLGNHGGIFDGGDDLQGAAAVGAVLNIDIEHLFEPPGLSHMRVDAE
jgi:hypothetical protein